MEYRVWNTDMDTLTPPLFVSTKILTKKVEVDTNLHKVSCEWICDEQAWRAIRE